MCKGDICMSNGGASNAWSPRSYFYINASGIACPSGFGVLAGFIIPRLYTCSRSVRERYMYLGHGLGPMGKYVLYRVTVDIPGGKMCLWCVYL